MSDDFATIPQIASGLLKHDMQLQVARMNSFANWMETLRSGRWPTRHTRAMHFIEHHEKEFRKEHRLSLPCPNAASVPLVTAG